MDEVMIRLHVEALDEGGYVATSPDVPGLVAEGRSIVEVTEIAQGLARKWPSPASSRATRFRQPWLHWPVTRSLWICSVPVGVR